MLLALLPLLSPLLVRPQRARAPRKRFRPWGGAASWTALAAPADPGLGSVPACQSLGAAPLSWGGRGRLRPPPPFLSVLSPAPAPDGRWRCREVAALPTNPRGCLVPHAERCVQEELTSTSVEHLIINPNAAYEKFKDKRLSTEGVGEPGGSGKGGLWGPRGDPRAGTAALGVLG